MDAEKCGKKFADGLSVIPCWKGNIWGYTIQLIQALKRIKTKVRADNVSHQRFSKN